MNQSEIREYNIQRVCDTAREMFLKNGIANTSINSIAENCGLSPMSIYRYFKNKDNLAARVWHDSLIWFYDQVFAPNYLQRSRNMDNGYDKFRACMDTYISIYAEHPEFITYSREMLYIATRVQESEDKDPEDADFWTRLFHEIPVPVMKALREGVEDGSIRPDTDINKVYQMVTNIYTGTNVFSDISSLDIFRYTAELLCQNIRNPESKYRVTLVEKNA